MKASTKRQSGNDGDVFRAGRTHCDNCGAPVKWVDGVAASEYGLDVQTAAKFNGSTVEQMDFWVCTKCDYAGAMSAPMFGGF